MPVACPIRGVFRYLGSGIVVTADEVQQPERTTPAQYDREQAEQAGQAAAVLHRADVLHPGGQAEASPEPSNQVSNDRQCQQWTPADADGRSLPGQAWCGGGSLYGDFGVGTKRPMPAREPRALAALGCGSGG